MRYFAELELPMAAVETALGELPAEWLAAAANKAHARALGFLLEASPELGAEFSGMVVDVGTQPVARHGSTTIRPMAWALIGPHTAKPLLDGDLEVGSLGHGRTQLAAAGRYHFPTGAARRRIDRGVAQRMGEATIKEFVDGLARMVEKLALGVPALRLPAAPPVRWRLKVG